MELDRGNVGTQTATAVIPQSITFQYAFSGRKFTIEVPGKVYFSRAHERQRPADYKDYLQPDPPLERIVEQIQRGAQTRIGTIEQILDFVTANVQYDSAKREVDKGYTNYPIETLVTKKGVCRDSALLTVILLQLAGVDAGMFIIRESEPGHAMVGVRLYPGEFLPVHAYSSDGKTQTPALNQAFNAYVRQRFEARKKGKVSPPPTKLFLPVAVYAGHTGVEVTLSDPRLAQGHPAIIYEGKPYVIINVTNSSWRIPKYIFGKGHEFIR